MALRITSTTVSNLAAAAFNKVLTANTGLLLSSAASVMPGLCSPSKKFLLTTTNNLNSSHMCGSNSTLASTGGKACTHFSDDHSISVRYYTSAQKFYFLKY